MFRIEAAIWGWTFRNSLSKKEIIQWSIITKFRSSKPPIEARTEPITTIRRRNTLSARSARWRMPSGLKPSNLPSRRAQLPFLQSPSVEMLHRWVRRLKSSWISLRSVEIGDRSWRHALLRMISVLNELQSPPISTNLTQVINLN